MTWPQLEARLQKIEIAPENRNRRIVRVFAPDPPDIPMFIGLLASAPVKTGEPSIQWNDGEVVPL